MRNLRSDKLQTTELLDRIQHLGDNVQRVIRGKPDVVKTTLIALFSGGHILIEDVPGVGKTTLAQALAKSTDLAFKRIQFTSDLLPTDILGVSVLDRNSDEFKFKRGPIFANIVLADEINRATPKTQSALLEAMNEASVTVDGTSYRLTEPFMVIATQNPFEYKGTFPLPENQLDRFSIRISIGYPDHESEKEILESYNPADLWEGILPVMSKDEVLILQGLVDKVRVDDSILDYVLSIVNATRDPNMFNLGVSPRGAIALKRAAQSRALVEGRTHCIPDDVKQMAIPVLAHRIVPKNGLRMGNNGGEEALEEVLMSVKVPI